MSFRRRRYTSGTRWFRLILACTPVRPFIRRRRSAVKRLSLKINAFASMTVPTHKHQTLHFPHCSQSFQIH